MMPKVFFFVKHMYDLTWVLLLELGKSVSEYQNMPNLKEYEGIYIDGLVQDCSISIGDTAVVH